MAGYPTFAPVSVKYLHARPFLLLRVPRLKQNEAACVILFDAAVAKKTKQQREMVHVDGIN